MIVIIFLILSALSFLCGAIGIQARIGWDGLGKTFFVCAAIFWKWGI